MKNIVLLILLIGFICAAESQNSCPENREVYDGKCYWFYFEKWLTLEKGKPYCEEYGGVPATIYSNEHFKWLMERARKAKPEWYAGFSTGMTVKESKLRGYDGSIIDLPESVWHRDNVDLSDTEYEDAPDEDLTPHIGMNVYTDANIRDNGLYLFWSPAYHDGIICEAKINYVVPFH